jgi:hypothetical protein
MSDSQWGFADSGWAVPDDAQWGLAGDIDWGVSQNDINI